MSKEREKWEEEEIGVATFKVPHHRNISTISPYILEAK